MAALKIRVFRDNEPTPETTFTIPLAMLKVASRLLPRKAIDSLEEHGIQVQQILELSRDEEVRGTLVEIEEHKKDKRIVILIE